MKEPHHRRVELVKVLPLRLTRGHHIDLGILKWPAIPHLGHDIFCVSTKGAVLANEQCHAQTPLLTENG